MDTWDNAVRAVVRTATGMHRDVAEVLLAASLPRSKSQLVVAQASTSNMVFHLAPPPRRIVRMPLPFASFTMGGSMPQPHASATATAKDGSSAQGANKGVDPSQPPLMVQPPWATRKRTQDEEINDETARVLISEVEVQGVDGELKQLVETAMQTRPNYVYSLKDVKRDVRRVFNTGYFKHVKPDAVDTRDGVKLVIQCTPNDEVRGLESHGASVLPDKVVQDAFQPLFGKTLNYVEFKKAVTALDQWYQSRGYVAQVTDFDIQDGMLKLQCAEAVVSKVDLQFMDPKTQKPSEKPRTRPEVILRHLTTQQGQVYNLVQAKRDINAIYSTGLFDDVNITPKESDDSTEGSPKVDLLVNLSERKTGGFGAGAGISAQMHGEGAMPGFVGSFSYNERNLFGLNQKLTAMVELGQVDKIFRVQHTDPWILGDPHRTSRTIQVMNTRTSNAIIHGRAEGEADAAGAGSSTSSSNPSGNVTLGRLLAGVEYRRPFAPSGWSGALEFNLQRTRCLGDHSTPITADCYGAPLTCSGSSDDHMAMAGATAFYSDAASESQALVCVEQAVPLRRNWLGFTRAKVKLDKVIPLGPAQLVLKAHGGAIHGDLPPYEAFPIGGTNSVRGYAEGAVGSGRRWMEGSAEVRFPLTDPLAASVFCDYGTDLGSGSSVVGDPAGRRHKPGKGYGYGAGVRVGTPVGPLRLEYAWNDKRVGRFHIGVGYE